MMRCLQENLWQPQFGQGCLQQVAVRGEAMQADFREDVSLAATCAPEIDSLCKAEQVPPLPPLGGAASKSAPLIAGALSGLDNSMAAGCSCWGSSEVSA